MYISAYPILHQTREQEKENVKEEKPFRVPIPNVLGSVGGEKSFRYQRNLLSKKM